MTASKTFNTKFCVIARHFIKVVFQRYQPWTLSLQRDTQPASYSRPNWSEPLSYLRERQMSCLQWQGPEQAPHPSHSVLRVFEFFSVCFNEYILRVCKCFARSTVDTYANPRSFAPLVTYPSFLISSLVLWAFDALSHLSRPSHRPPTIRCLLYQTQNIIIISELGTGDTSVSTSSL